MSRLTAQSAFIIICLAATLTALFERTACAADAPNAYVVNRGVVELETGPATDISVRMAAEIAKIIDDGATRRVVPVIGRGPLQNLIDLKLLRGIDMAIIQADALDYAREQHFLPGVESTISYIAKLYNEEFYLLARTNIKSITDLADQRVNVGQQGSGSAITATRLFDLLHIKANMVTDDDDAALEKLRKGDIAALAVVAAKPSALLQKITPADHLHLIGIPLAEAVTNSYAPTRITAADYPDLVAAAQPVDTVAVGNVLMAADLRAMPERYRNMTNFVDAFFTGFQTLLKPGYDRRWAEVNVAADLSGWRRFPPAADWIEQNAQVAAAPDPAVLKVLFSRFIDERRQANGGATLSDSDKNALFQQFEEWQHRQASSSH